ncbi:RsiV family protein [Solibacillus cecembensis]|uniref:RsiV family protein n=1 Tax=Solibacillus cecembensis TaxID=459347 RepID=UPI003D06C1F9
MLHLVPVSINTFIIRNGAKQMVLYPQVEYLHRPQWQAKINHAIVEQTRHLMIEQYGNMPTTVDEMLGYFEIKNNQRQVLSLTQSNYTYHSHAANGMSYLKSLTFDMLKEQICTLKDLFIPNSDYIARISALIHEQIKRRNIPLINTFTVIKPDQDFYIADKTLVIYFQLFEITPHYFGFPIFPISVYDLSDIIDENGPLGRLAENN